MLTTEHIAVVKSTIPLLEVGGDAITEHFYQRLFTHNPELKNIFNMSNQQTGRQKTALFGAILAYAKNIDNLAVLKHAVERIVQKHTSFHVEPAHYDVVGLHLIETLRELLPEQFTEEVETAWTAAYGVLANVFINREEELYSQRENTLGGWRGKRAFCLVDKVVESALVTSFVFEPMDHQPVIDYQVGQYVGVELTPQGSDYVEIRQYSLSSKPNGKSYRISVKRELGEHDGLMSNHLHDHLNVGDLVDLHAPAGDFFFVDRSAPVVLISAGVGITPMQAMLEKLAAEHYAKPVYYLHACENASQHSFANRTEALCNRNDWHFATWYKEECSTQPHVHHGLIDFSQVDLPIKEGHFYLCGPVGFMQFAKTNLIKQGVDESRIHYEVFGPHATL
ncbi:NO-inducible flavohemoprotein [Algibacillus agarilyticus]|uniref:NO-inducible flavohemoprotein n=1 Tax=Algibacillus agarilyticus TaxID=2234133 RepID=UPI000DCFCBD9|nr:NO-inducible flavohemoprotein [Algibacillus agarilyticus]